jgi:hypothetical protein
MSEHVTLGPTPPPAASLPDWMRVKVLQLGEQVVWWEGPTEAAWQRWCKTFEMPLTLLGMGCAAAFPLLGTNLGPPGFFIGGLLGFGVLVGLVLAAGSADRLKWHVLTDRRLLIVTGRNKTEEFDLAMLRRLMAALGTAPAPAGATATDPRFDFTKLGQIQAASTGVTDLNSILALVRLAQQMKGVQLPEPGITSGGERPTG